MNINNLLQKSAFFALMTAFLFTGVYAQKAEAPAPRQEKLLNGLKLLMWNEPRAEKVSVLLRVHSGSAFDPKDKEGVMALLADALFPNENAKEFFTEELGGSLDITSNYDYIQVSATGNSDKVLRILDTLAAAVSNPTIDKEITAKIKTARLEKVKELEKNPVSIAARAAANRLLGDFPYGRAQAGTSKSLAKIDYADLLFAQERFLTADNATLAISGNIDTDLIYRAARRYFGAWRKSEKRIPATFAQPEAPDEKKLGITSEHAENSQVRYAMRGLARSDKDFYASEILTRILQNRLQNQMPGEYGRDIFVRQEANLLPGVIIYGYTSQPVPVAAAPLNPTPGKNENIVTLILTGSLTSEEFNRAKNEFLNEFNRKSLAENWLDAHTYKLPSVKDEMQKANSVTLADVQRVADRLRKEPIVAVSLMKKPQETAEKPAEKQESPK